jgi:hypothetical protein
MTRTGVLQTHPPDDLDMRGQIQYGTESTNPWAGLIVVWATVTGRINGAALEATAVDFRCTRADPRASGALRRGVAGHSRDPGRRRRHNAWLAQELNRRGARGGRWYGSSVRAVLARAAMPEPPEQSPAALTPQQTYRPATPSLAPAAPVRPHNAYRPPNGR